MASKNKLQETLDATLSKLAAARKRASGIAARASEMTSEVFQDAVQIAVTAMAGYANGRMESYTILGVDAALAMGLPLALAGIGATVMGYGTLGRWIGVAGLGFLNAYAFKRAYMAGWAARHPDEAKAGKAPSLQGDPSVASGPPPLLVDWGESTNGGVRHSQRNYART